MPKFVEPDPGCGDFWYLGCIDATLWWLIAIKMGDQATQGSLEKRFQSRIQRALAWLSLVGANNRRVAEQMLHVGITAPCRERSRPGGSG